MKFRKSTYHLTRFVLLRLLGFVYLFAFLSLATQVIPLIGHDGLYPADLFLEKAYHGTILESFCWSILNHFLKTIFKQFSMGKLKICDPQNATKK